MTFTLAEVLTITTGRLLCDMGNVYKILNFLTQDNGNNILDESTSSKVYYTADVRGI